MQVSGLKTTGCTLVGGVSLRDGAPELDSPQEHLHQVAEAPLARVAWEWHHPSLDPCHHLRWGGLLPTQFRPNAAPDRGWPGCGPSAGMLWWAPQGQQNLVVQNQGEGKDLAPWSGRRCPGGWGWNEWMMHEKGHWGKEWEGNCRAKWEDKVRVQLVHYLMSKQKRERCQDIATWAKTKFYSYSHTCTTRIHKHSPSCLSKHYYNVGYPYSMSIQCLPIVY